MADEIKAPEAPVVTPEAPADEPIIDNRRQQIEKAVTTFNETVPEPEVDTPEAPVPTEPEPKKEEPKTEEDPLERIKKSVQKRIDKVVAQKKSVEEELVETKAELERLRTKQPESSTSPVPTKKEELTVAEIKDWLAQNAKAGNVLTEEERNEVTVLLVEAKAREALREVEDRQSKTQREEESKKAKQLSDWVSLQKDYEDVANPDLNLSNQKGLLYKTALSLYNDKELHADFYNNPDVMQGFRRAVADAYREIHQQGLIKNTPKGETVIPRNPRMALADPSAEAIEDAPQVNSSTPSDAEKVRDEIKARNKNRFLRKIPQ